MAGAILLILLGALGYRLLSANTISPLPSDIRQSLTFSPLVVPKDSKTYETTSYKYGTVEDSTPILSFLITSETSTVSVSEYVQPSEFTEIPEYKTQFLSNVIKQYATVQTSNGTLYLGRGVKQNNRQLAVMLEHGLVMFLTPIDSSRELDERAWRSIGETLEIEKIQN